MPGPEDPCDAACVKIIIDTGMGRFAANMYAAVISQKPDPLHAAAARFYGDVVSSVERVALVMNRHGLNAEQRERMMKQINEECYRSDKLISWAKNGATAGPETLEKWTTDILGWAKDDQNFYTALAGEIA